MWDKLNTLQRRIVFGGLAILALMILFPPIQIERTISGLSDGRRNLTLTTAEFHGWGFIGQVDFTPQQKPKRPKDPRNPTLLERFEAARPMDLDALRKGTKRIDFATLAKQVVLLFLLGGAAIFLTRTSVNTAD